MMKQSTHKSGIGYAFVYYSYVCHVYVTDKPFSLSMYKHMALY